QNHQNSRDQKLLFRNSRGHEQNHNRKNKGSNVCPGPAHRSRLRRFVWWSLSCSAWGKRQRGKNCCRQKRQAPGKIPQRAGSQAACRLQVQVRKLAREIDHDENRHAAIEIARWTVFAEDSAKAKRREQQYVARSFRNPRNLPQSSPTVSPRIRRIKREEINSQHDDED